MANIYLVVVIIILAANFCLTFITETLNLKNITPEMPDEFTGYYDADKYKKSQDYLRENTKFDITSDAILLAATLLFIIAGGFNFADKIARGVSSEYYFTGLIFAGLLMLLSGIANIPFSAYHTFVIEEKFGFNKTTAKTFILDILKSWLLAAVIGGAVFTFILWVFEKAGNFAWLFCWLGTGIIEIFLMFIAPVVLMPIFNKFLPLEEGELKSAIENYAEGENFRISGVFKMDGSKRSSKSNAFFTGLGKFRRIVLFDTLIKNHTVQEIVAVLAHEVGHFKKKHILKFLLISLAASGVMFFILSLFVENRSISEAFKMDNVSVYAGIFFFMFFYAPINFALSIAINIFSRKFEYDADRYAVQSQGNSEAFITALKKLSVDNLANLNPHPLKIFLEYTHPPILDRIKAIREHRA